MKYTIDITQEDIDHGKQYNCSECPIARAAQRTLNQDKRLSVGLASFTIWDSPGGVEAVQFASLPLKAVRFIRKFDHDKTSVLPISFEVELEDATN